MSIKLLLAGVALAAAAVPAAASSVVQFTGNPSTSWTDGTFTTGLSGDFADGFYNSNYGATGAYNGFGQNDESIIFNAPVKLISLELGNCNFCADTNVPFTASLYAAGGGLIASATVPSSTALTLLTFNASSVKTVTFSFTGGTDVYHDGRQDGWYHVDTVTYGAVPEAATWAMMIAGFGLVGATLRQRRTTVAA